MCAVRCAAAVSVPLCRAQRRQQRHILTRVSEIGANPPDLAAKPPDPAKWPGAEGAVKMAPQAKKCQNTVT